MSERLPILIAAAGNCLVASVTLVAVGWTASGLHAAARNTARFSAVWFMGAFAAPRLTRLVSALPPETDLIRAFVAAHLVHFAVVALLLEVFERTHVTQNLGRAAAVVLGGFLLVISIGLLAAPQRSRIYSLVRALLLYAVFAIFSLAFLRTPVKPLHLLSVFLGLALILRLSSAWAFYSARAKSGEQR